MPMKRFYLTAAPLAIVALAGMGLATAQSSSPFAPKTSQQAWDQQPAAPRMAPQGTLSYNAAPSTVAAPSYQAPSYHAPAIPASADAPITTHRRRAAAMPSYSAATPPKTFGGRSAAPAAQNLGLPPLAGASTPPAAYIPRRTKPAETAMAQAPDFGSPTPPQPVQPQYNPAQTSSSPFAPQSGQRPQAWETQSAPAYQAPSSQPPAPGYVPNGYVPGYQSSVPPTGAPYPGGPYSGAPQQPLSWSQRLGLDNIATLIRGKLNIGGAATYREQPPNQLGPDDGWSDDQIVDAELEFEASAITQGGLEYGVALGVRGQYDPYRRGFGGRLPDCPPTAAGCSGQAAGLATGLRGHTSGFYSTGEDIATDAQIAVESAHLFLRSAYGDVTIGRDDGAAYLFSLGAPTLLAVGASNSPVDYTGYDSVKTVNDASGFAEKITYTSPRLLGDQIGVGVQLGLSYALDADVCGVDYCNGRNIAGLVQPEIEDVLEAGIALDRTFDNGLRAELTGTYARGSETSGAAGLDDLQSFGAGLEFEYGDWTLGGSYLNSNNGLLDGDYTAYDAGLTWKPGALGFTLGYGHAKDDNVGLTSDQGTFGVTYDFEKFTLGTGVQYVDRDVQGLVGGVPTTLDQRATSVFVQGGFKF